MQGQILKSKKQKCLLPVKSERFSADQVPASIWQISPDVLDHLLRYMVFSNMMEYVNGFSLRHDQTGKLLYDALHIPFMELSKLERIIKNFVSEITNIDKWLEFFKDVSSSEYWGAKEVLQMGGNVLLRVSQNKQVRLIAVARNIRWTCSWI